MLLEYIYMLIFIILYYFFRVRTIGVSVGLDWNPFT
jgi:hypothetical protein